MPHKLSITNTSFGISHKYTWTSSCTACCCVPALSTCTFMRIPPNTPEYPPNTLHKTLRIPFEYPHCDRGHVNETIHFGWVGWDLQQQVAYNMYSFNLSTFAFATTNPSRAVGLSTWMLFVIFPCSFVMIFGSGVCFNKHCVRQP